MSYQVLARKWRPRTFKELVGQEHVVRPLVNALEHGRLHHAFLFTGTRGVGKTTVARILAKALNCERGVTAEPCGECTACREVDEGRFVDLIEVDAASRTKVDDTRELLDNVPYAPTRGRYKVYLIDEVHMLSGHSFNALLKTLEEPPPHVKFLLATTDPQKLPVTILSRCLQFHLKRLSEQAIAAQLRKILAAEGVEHDEGSLALLARAADGSLRDGLSLLDQAIAYGGGRLAVTDVRAMLGTIDQDALERALAALAAADARTLLAVVADLVEHGRDPAQLLDELLWALHHIALAQAGLAPDAGGEEGAAGLAAEYAARLSPEDVQLYYQIALLGKRDLPLAPHPRVGTEMTLLRMLAFRPADVADSGHSANTAPAADAARATATRCSAPAAAARPDDWGTVVAQLNLSGLVRELANNTAPASWEADCVTLVLDESRAQLYSKDRVAELGKALEAHYGRPLRLVVRTGRPPGETPAQARDRVLAERQQAARQAILNDPHVRAIERRFDARVELDSIRPRPDA